MPVVITGAYEAMSSGKKKVKSGSKLIISFLPPVEPFGRTPEELNSLIKGQIAETQRKNYQSI